MKLSFMTWLCPEWDVKKIIKGAKKYKYDGVEIRTDNKQKHNIELFTGKKSRNEVKKMFKEEGIEISCIATGLQFANEDKKEREKCAETLKEFIDLAVDIGCPYLRVFGGKPASMKTRGIVQYTAESLVGPADYAIGTDVEILLETHDHFSHSLRVASVIREANHRKLNALWDVMHPFGELESFDMSYKNLSPFIRHIHVHDGKYNQDKSKIDICFLGEGVIDHTIPMKLLKDDGFKGHFSIEIIGKGEPDRWLSQYSKKFYEYKKKLI